MHRARLLAAALFVAACSDGVSPAAPFERGGPGLPMFDVAATGDQSGGLNQSGTVIGARFGPTNPHRGDAIIATFFWLGSTNIIDSVTDFLTDANSTPVGNTYRLVEYVGAGGISMATYVATNVQNFPDPSDPPTSVGLAVRANLHTAVTDGGVLLSAWSGVQDVSTQHRSASGSGSAPTVAAAGAITIGAGDLAYAATMSNAVVGRNGSPQGFTNLAVQSDPYIADQADYLASASGGTADPRWTWNFTQASTWLASVLSLTTTAPPPGGTGNLTATASTTGSSLDADGYTVTVDQTTSQAIASNGGSVTFTGLAAGSHTVVLSGVAANCTVSGGNTRTVSVPTGGTATVSFSVACTTPPSGSGIKLDQLNGTLNQTEGSCRCLIKGFNPTNPHRGDAIIATFFWFGSTNIIDSVTDVLTSTPYTPVGNQYQLVEYVTSGGVSMATYIATNVQNFPDPNTDPGAHDILAVRASLSTSIPDGGLMISAWSGVASVATQALGAHRAASGSGTTTTVADLGSMAIGPGALAYGITMANALVGRDGPSGFGLLNAQSDAMMVNRADTTVAAAAGSVDPRWTWYFSQQSTWLATALVLNPETGSANQPPVAAFGSSCSALSCAFTSTSSDPDGTIASYSWTFGDGATSTLQNPSHSYTATGSYTVTLTVTDNQGATNAVSHGVTVTAANQPPTADFTFSCSGLGCTFTSTSSDPDGTIANYSWTFGDGGTSTAQNPSHSYATGGSYTVTLRVTDNQGAASATTSKTVTVTPPNQAPTANFTFSCSGLGCNFTSTSSDPDGSIASYSWTFGDGGTSTAQNPSHSYAAGGSYAVTLRVTDNQGAASTTTSKTVTVTAPNQAPVVNAGPDEHALTGLLYSTSFSFSDANNNGPWSYTINWGDGSTSTGTRTAQGTFSVGHTYVIVLPRNFTITVTVRDAAGASGADSKVVSVTLL